MLVKDCPFFIKKENKQGLSKEGEYNRMVWINFANIKKRLFKDTHTTAPKLDFRKPIPLTKYGGLFVNVNGIIKQVYECRNCFNLFVIEGR